MVLLLLLLLHVPASLRSTQKRHSLLQTPSGNCDLFTLRMPLPFSSTAFIFRFFILHP